MINKNNRQQQQREKPLGIVMQNSVPQMIAAHKFLIAHRTREILFACVRTNVTRQFVGARKSLAATGPTARKRPFAGVRTQMGLQMGTFPIDFGAAVVDAFVNFSHRCGFCRRSAIRRRGLVSVLAYARHQMFSVNGAMNGRKNI